MQETTSAVLSETFETGAEKNWWKNAVFYEVYVDRFAGTFADFSKRLDYLANLGITCVHLLPHYPSPMVDDGYDVSDYRDVRPELGTLGDFSHFVQAAHSRGIRVMIDFVLNHVSTSHPWFVEASSSKKNPKRDYFLWSETGEEFATTPSPFPDLRESNWVRNPATGDYYFSTFYPEQADLNWDNPRVFDEMTGVIDFWAALGVDGFRLDASSHLIKREGTNSHGLPETHAILKRLRAHIEKLGPDIAILAEVHDSLAEMIRYFGDGDECHMVYHFPMVEQIFLSFIRGTSAGIEKLAELSAGIPDNCSWALFLRHHDEISLATLAPGVRAELLDYYDPERKWRFSEGTSLRLSDMMKNDIGKTLDAYRLLFGLPGTPFIYYGDEIGMRNVPLAPAEKDTRRALRGKFDWAAALIAERNPASLLRQVAMLLKARRHMKPTEESIPERTAETEEKIPAAV
ncbi:MAG TPA: alpha-amylase family glycosyl hydrolase [Candidatus Paceibacterota bacterium]|jgi:maltose alpha-D-glucosyltransferase/alpha-amylase|nr:alpha-amylase family glycosyl hydrolase [Candidatus Paceibacterota bacterium]